MAGPELNKVFLVGRLTRDPELKYIQSGSAVTELGLAVNRSYRTSGGEQKEDTTFVDVTVWGRLAEVCSEYLNKGSAVLVEGRLQLDTWETSDGQRRNKMRVVANNCQFLGGRQDGKGKGGGSQSAGGKDKGAPVGQEGPPNEDFTVDDDSIPF